MGIIYIEKMLTESWAAAPVGEAEEAVNESCR